MNFAVVISNRQQPLPPATISEHPRSGEPLTLDEAREILEACLYGAAQGFNLVATKAARRTIASARSAQPGSTFTVGPVSVAIRPTGILIN